MDIDVNQLANSINNRADRDLNNVLANIDFVVESKMPTAADPTWYRKWKSGWLEQGGIQYGNGTYGITTVTLLKPFANVNYHTSASILWMENPGWYSLPNSTTMHAVTDVSGAVTLKTVNSFGIQSFSAHNWYACGQGAN